MRHVIGVVFVVLCCVGSGCGSPLWNTGCKSDSDCGSYKCISSYNIECGDPTCSCDYTNQCTLPCTTDADCASIGGKCLRSSSCNGAKNVCEKT